MSKAFKVRGRVFASNKACAKHFDLTVRHVRDMRAKGRQDSIGTGGGRHKSPLDQRMQVTVRGKTFPTAEACAAHFGIEVNSVYSSLANGRPDSIGLGKGAGNRGRITRTGKSLTIGPFTFPSLQRASLFLGFSKGYVAMAMRGANKCSMKSVIERAMAKAAEIDAAQRQTRLKWQVAA